MTTKNDLTITRVSGSQAIDENTGAANVVDISHSTRFSSLGVGSYLDLEVADKAEFNTICLAFKFGGVRKTKFTVTQTDDFKEFTPTEPHTFVSEATDSPQNFYIKKTKAKGVRISFEGNQLVQENRGPINGVAASVAGTGRPNATGVQSSTFPTAPTGTLTYTDSSSQYTNHASPLGVALGPNVTNNNDLFEVTRAVLLNTDLEKDQEKALNDNVKAFKDIESKDSTCLRCNSKTDKGICTKCGIKGDYEHPEPEHIKSSFPSTVTITGQHVNVNKVDTTPSATQPPIVNTRPITTPAKTPSQSGNTIVVGTEIVQEGQISQQGVDQVVDSKTTLGQTHVVEKDQSNTSVQDQTNNKSINNENKSIKQEQTNKSIKGDIHEPVFKKEETGVTKNQHVGFDAADDKGKPPNEQASDAAKDNKTQNTPVFSNNTARVQDKSNTATTKVDGDKVNTTTSTTTTLKDKKDNK